MKTLLTAIMISLGWTPYKMYEVKEPKDGIKIVALVKLDGLYIHEDDKDSVLTTLYMRADEIVYKESEITKLKRNELRDKSIR
jgi:hypothetical protein